MTTYRSNGLRWVGLLSASLLMGSAMALGCGSAAPSGGGSTPVPIELSFPSSLAVGTSEATGATNLAAPVNKNLLVDFASSLPGSTSVDQALYFVDDNMTHLDAILTLLKDVKATTGSSVTSYTWTTAAGTKGSIDFAAKDFPTFSAQSFSSVDCSTACSGHAGTYPICVAVKLNGKRIWFGKFTKLPEGSSKGAGCFRTVSALSCAGESACIEGETYLLSGVWDYTDEASRKLELYATTTAADTNGFAFPTAHSYLTDESSGSARKITVNTTVTMIKNGTDGSVNAVIRNLTGTKKVYVNTLTLTGSAGSASDLQTCRETTTGSATTGCDDFIVADTVTVVTAATAGDTGVATALLASDTGRTSDTTAPSVSSVSPSDGATGQEAAATVALTFSEAMDQTATAAAVSLTLNPAVPVSAAWSADSRTLTLTPSTDLRVGSRKYTVTVGPGAKDSAGNTVAASSATTFRSRDHRTATIVSGTGTQDVATGGHPGLVADSSGVLHACWVEQSSNDLFYTQCSGSCNTATNWSTSVAIQTENVNNPNCAIAAAPGGGINVVYSVGRFLRFTRCTSGCTDAASWSGPITIDDVASTAVGPALTADSANALHVAVDGTASILRYVTCASGCSDARNWTAVTVDSGRTVGTHASIAVSGSTLGIAYEDTGNQQLRFASCSSVCTSGRNWSSEAVDTSTNNVGRQPSLRIEDSGRFHVLHKVVGTGDDLRYSTCGSNCTTAANWSHVTFESASTIGGIPSHSLAIDSRNALHAIAFNNSEDANAGLLYFLCEGTCTTAANWRKVTVATGTQTGVTNVIAIGPRDKVFGLFTATDSTTDTTGDLKFFD